MRHIILGFTLLGLAIHSIGAAHAATISFDASFGPTAIANPTTTIPLLKFDPGLGTLTLVELSLDANTSAGTIDWDNEAGIPSDVTLGIGAEVTASAPSALAAIAVPLQVGSSTVTADNDGAADFIGTDAFSVTGGSGNDSDIDSSGLAATLLIYTATFAGETFNTDIDSLLSTFLSTTGGFGPIQTFPGTFDGTVEVIYTFTPIPEPSTAALAALGLLGLGWFGWRRRR